MKEGHYQFNITGNRTLFMNVSDLLVKEGEDCLLKITVLKEFNITQDFIAMSLQTMARSHYLVYDFTSKKLGFGGNVSNPVYPPPEPITSFPAWAVILIVLGVLLVVGLGVFVKNKICRKRT